MELARHAILTRLFGPRSRSRRFLRDDSGMALSEYVVLLGLLSGSVALTVMHFGTALAGAWSSQGAFIQSGLEGAGRVERGAVTSPAEEPGRCRGAGMVGNPGNDKQVGCAGERPGRGKR